MEHPQMVYYVNKAYLLCWVNMNPYVHLNLKLDINVSTVLIRLHSSPNVAFKQPLRET